VPRTEGCNSASFTRIRRKRVCRTRTTSIWDSQRPPAMSLII
jgi:hypothetical protein